MASQRLPVDGIQFTFQDRMLLFTELISRTLLE
jgi:hypothetical protein